MLFRYTHNKTNTHLAPYDPLLSFHYLDCHNTDCRLVITSDGFSLISTTWSYRFSIEDSAWSVDGFDTASWEDRFLDMAPSEDRVLDRSLDVLVTTISVRTYTWLK